jgi:hypothetical protein
MFGLPDAFGVLADVFDVELLFPPLHADAASVTTTNGADNASRRRGAGIGSF